MPRSASSRTEQSSRRELDEFAADVRAGLTKADQKELHSKYLYDELGTALFEAITHLPEYGLTRADTRLLGAHADEIATMAGGAKWVAEFGSGTGQKSRILLEALAAKRETRPCYYPIDISVDALMACEHELAAIADVRPVPGTYLEGLAHVTAHRPEHEPLLLLFLGSTIGNFERPCAREFLAGVRGRLQPGDAFLVGADLVKPVEQLLAAYDDPTGVTAAFNLNLLGRINRELGGNFDIRAFAHEARYNGREQRIEMHLRSRGDQEVSIPGAGCIVQFRKGETIWTESSHKFEQAQLAQMAVDAGFQVRSTWVDEQWPFAEALWVAI